MNRTLSILAQMLIYGPAFFHQPVLAQDAKFLENLSPKLKQFVSEHAGASPLLSNALAKAFSGKVVHVFYFYTDDDAIPQAYHYYPDESGVVIVLRENQKPLDEFVCLFFELINSEGEKRFKEIYSDATSGSLSKTNFVKEILKEEFKAVKRTKVLLRTLELSEAERADAGSYTRFAECPDDFDGFLSHTRKNPHRNPIKEYEAIYDSLRKPSAKSD